MRGRGRIFEDTTKLAEMLRLRREGIGPSELGLKYGVDHTTIIYHCKRNGIAVTRTKEGVTGVAVVVQQPVKQAVRISIATGEPRVILDGYDNTPICGGAMYADYVASVQRMKSMRVLSKVTNGSLLLGSK